MSRGDLDDIAACADKAQVPLALALAYRALRREPAVLTVEILEGLIKCAQEIACDVVLRAASVHLSHGQVQHAASLLECLVHHVSDPNAHECLGYLYLRAGAQTSGIHHLRQAGELFSQRAEWAEACELYQSLLLDCPHDLNVHVRLGAAHVQLGHTQTATQMAQALLAAGHTDEGAALMAQLAMHRDSFRQAS